MGRSQDKRVEVRGGMVVCPYCERETNRLGWNDTCYGCGVKWRDDGVYVLGGHVFSVWKMVPKGTLLVRQEVTED